MTGDDAVRAARGDGRCMRSSWNTPSISGNTMSNGFLASTRLDKACSFSSKMAFTTRRSVSDKLDRSMTVVLLANKKALEVELAINKIHKYLKSIRLRQKFDNFVDRSEKFKKINFICFYRIY